MNMTDMKVTQPGFWKIRLVFWMVITGFLIGLFYLDYRVGLSSMFWKFHVLLFSFLAVSYTLDYLQSNVENKFLKETILNLLQSQSNGDPNGRDQTDKT